MEVPRAKDHIGMEINNWQWMYKFWMDGKKGILTAKFSIACRELSLDLMGAYTFHKKKI